MENKIFLGMFMILVFISACSERNVSQSNSVEPSGVYDLTRAPLRIVTRAVVVPKDIIPPDLVPNHVRGAHLYDNLLIEAGVSGLGDNPLAAFAVDQNGLAGTSLAGDEGWRCVNCHGWDYEGMEFIGGATNNLLELKEVRGIDEPYVYNALTQGFDILVDGVVTNVHNYSSILTDLQRADLGDFTAEETFDTHIYLKAAAGGTVVNGMDIMPYGMEIWNGTVQPNPPLDGGDGSMRDIQGNAFSCVSCHEAASTVTDAQVFSVAKTDPWYFFFRTLWGSPRTGSNPSIGDINMMPGLLEIIKVNPLYFGEAADGAAVLAHAQAQP